MASPQTENGYTKIANELMTVFISTAPFVNTKTRIVLWVIRESYGWNRKTTPPISVSGLAKQTLGDRKRTREGLLELVASGVIRRDEDGALTLVKDYESWVFGPGANAPGGQMPHGAKHPQKGGQMPPEGGANAPVLSYEKKRLKKERKGDPLFGFPEFWTAYPWKIGYGAAEKAWAALAPDPALQVRIMAALEAQKRNDAWKKNDGEFIPKPSRWLEEARWNDDLSRHRDAPAKKSAAQLHRELQQRLEGGIERRPPGLRRIGE